MKLHGFDSNSIKYVEACLFLPWTDCISHHRGPGQSSCLTSLWAPSPWCVRRISPWRTATMPSGKGKLSKSPDVWRGKPTRYRLQRWRFRPLVEDCLGRRSKIKPNFLMFWNNKTWFNPSWGLFVLKQSKNSTYNKTPLVSLTISTKFKCTYLVIHIHVLYG